MTETKRPPRPRMTKKRKALDLRYRRFGGLAGYVKHLYGRQFTYQQIAERVGVSFSSVYEYINGRTWEKDKKSLQEVEIGSKDST